MRRRRGSALMFVLVMSVIFLMMCRAVMNLTMGSGLFRARAVRGATAKADLDGAAAKAWGCLTDKGYPPAGTCQPAGAQNACFPAGFDFTFSGSFPDCRMRIEVDK